MTTDVLRALLPLAHSGPGASWQALLFVATLGVTILAVLAWRGQVPVRSFDDLVLPLAGIAIASSLAPVADEVLSDLVGWFLPSGAAALVLLVAYATWEAGDHARRNAGTVLLGIGVVGSILFGSAIGRSVHPPLDDALFPDDVAIAITAPSGGATATSPVEVVVEVTGGSVGAPEDVDEVVSDDPEENGFVVLFVDGAIVEQPPAGSCTRDEPCTTLTWSLDVEPGDRRVQVEFRPSGGRAFTSAVFDSVQLTVDG